MKINVDSNFCAGTGVCVESCPQIFEFDSDGASRVKVDTVPIEFQKTCMEIASKCPTNAISIEE